MKSHRYLFDLKIIRTVVKSTLFILVAGTSHCQDPGLKDLKTWSIAECGKIFKESVKNLKTEFKKLPPGDNLVWDKDDKDALDFVAACANIRAYIFGIEQKTRFDIKCRTSLQ